ncbi:cystathionine gamma-synthase [Aliidiomarina iranensis]|uniref:Cytochrome c-type biogenesis protein n=1 Tax=Aliidiomarina iranensis TaxID=1434071 RepID=A0A432VQ93_9GAMM|nr:cytochrome c-type biogenesis protein [Aliidiomarina iranensis]RUO18316.1 cystathionine gamma-synthase [Aliidiomarina iranensis]
MNSRILAKFNHIGFLLVLFTAVVGATAIASNEFYEFETAAQERQFNTLAGELRCPKCQNQTIADSDAPLAQDMRERVYQMIMEGKSNAEIIDFMKVRYGDFVHYRPPVNSSTLVLWLAPLGVILIGALAVWFNVRQQRNASAELTPEEEARMNDIFSNTENPAKPEERDN